MHSLVTIIKKNGRPFQQLPFYHHLCIDCHGKFLAGVAFIAIMMVSIVLVIAGLGLIIMDRWKVCLSRDFQGR